MQNQNYVERLHCKEKIHKMCQFFNVKLRFLEFFNHLNHFFDSQFDPVFFKVELKFYQIIQEFNNFARLHCNKNKLKSHREITGNENPRILRQSALEWHFESFSGIFASTDLRQDQRNLRLDMKQWCDSYRNKKRMLL